MKYAIVALAGLLALGACTAAERQAVLDRVNPEIRCMLEPIAREKALEHGLPVDELLDALDVVICPAPTVTEAVEEGFTVVE